MSFVSFAWKNKFVRFLFLLNVLFNFQFIIDKTANKGGRSPQVIDVCGTTFQFKIPGSNPSLKSLSLIALVQIKDSSLDSLSNSIPEFHRDLIPYVFGRTADSLLQGQQKSGRIQSRAPPQLS